jgi:hypothetical protein
VADVAVISVISTGVVGILGAATAMYGQRTTFATEREKRREARRDDLRGVLDGAAADAIAYQRPLADDEATQGSILVQIEQLGPELVKHQARIGVRLGTQSAVYLRYYEVVAATGTLANKVAALPSELTMDETAASEDARPAWERAKSATDDLNARIEAFFNAASELVGVD